MDQRAVTLPSKTFSCEELGKGAALAADLAGLSLVADPSQLSREDLLKSIEDLMFLDSTTL